MRTCTSRRRRLVGSVFIALLLGGCATGAATDVASTGPSSPSASARDEAIEELTSVIFGVGNGDEAEAQEAWRADEVERQERVAACMREAGFEYVVVTPPVATSNEPELDYWSREYAETYGFGYTTRFDESYDSGSEWTDPNNDYVNSLSDAEQQQYYVTLYGDQSVWDEIESEEDAARLQAEEPERFEPSGCDAASFPDDTRTAQIVWETFGAELEDATAAAMADPDLVAALDEWSNCMAGEGLDFTTPDDFDSVMDPWITRLYDTASHPAGEYTEEEMAAMSDDELNALWNQPTVYDADLLAEAQNYEIRLAVTSWDCGANDLYESYGAAYARAVHRFVDQNLDALTELTS